MSEKINELTNRATEFLRSRVDSMAQRSNLSNEQTPSEIVRGASGDLGQVGGRGNGAAHDAMAGDIASENTQQATRLRMIKSSEMLLELARR